MTTVMKTPLLHGLRDIVVAVVCLVTLGLLCGGGVLAILAPPVIVLSLLPLIVLLLLFNPKARRQNGWSGIAATVSRGFVMLLPFTVLAAASQVWLHWNAAQLFTSSGLMAVGAATGFEMVRIGGGRIAGALLPTVWFALLAIIWMLFSGLVASAMAGA